jgi:hypothetical protein
MEIDVTSIMSIDHLALGDESAVPARTKREAGFP